MIERSIFMVMKWIGSSCEQFTNTSLGSSALQHLFSLKRFENETNAVCLYATNVFFLFVLQIHCSACFCRTPREHHTHSKLRCLVKKVVSTSYGVQKTAAQKTVVWLELLSHKTALDCTTAVRAQRLGRATLLPKKSKRIWHAARQNHIPQSELFM